MSYHHHVAIHGLGMEIDPDSPPQRRRLRWNRNHDPPEPQPLLISGTSMGNSQLSNPDQLVGTFFILAANG